MCSVDRIQLEARKALRYSQSAFRDLQVVQGGPLSSHLIRRFLHRLHPPVDLAWGRLCGMEETNTKLQSQDERDPRGGEPGSLIADVGHLAYPLCLPCLIENPSCYTGSTDPGLVCAAPQVCSLNRCLRSIRKPPNSKQTPLDALGGSYHIPNPQHLLVLTWTKYSHKPLPGSPFPRLNVNFVSERRGA